jgi:hypothetical protein
MVSNREGKAGVSVGSAFGSADLRIASASAAKTGANSVAGLSGRTSGPDWDDLISFFIGIDLGFHAKPHRPEAEAQLGRADAKDATWFVALPKEQLALITDDGLHGFSFRLGLANGSARQERTPRAEDSERLNRNAGVKIALPKTLAIGSAVRSKVKIISPGFTCSPALP